VNCIINFDGLFKKQIELNLYRKNFYMRNLITKNKIKKGAVAVLLFATSNVFSQSYNTLWIPDTLSGTTFNLNIKDTFAQIVNTGNQTITGGINGKIWGPTLFFNKGDVVRMNVKNGLNDSTTIHWHGMHLPAVMDGGPHQVIPPGSTWQPYWEVKNDAATYWYHPHLHEMTEEQITKGIGGLIIVRDEVESKLALPRTYGIDDIPLVLTDRDFNTSNQFTVVPYGDSMMVNGTLRPQYTIPAQVVRFRILNGALERSYNLGFSDGRNFQVITSDGGLLAAPVSLTRYILHAGERIEILIDCSNDLGKSVNLRAYNSTLPQNIAGGDLFPNGPFANFLARKDFDILRINVGSKTSNPITTIPTTLRTVNTIPATDAKITRSLTITDTNIVGNNGVSFLINHKLFNINFNNYDLPLNNTEIWEITSTSNFGHPFHIHDVEFNILSSGGVAPAAAQAGWKDVVFVPARSTVKFIAKFDDYADSLHPFMYHCHISLHEDDGMMGQFVVTDKTSSIKTVNKLATDFTIYPNPANEKLYFSFNNSETKVYYVSILNIVGKAVIMLPRPEWQNGIDISNLAAGTYFVQLTDDKTKTTTVKKFVKE
jgi:bilirubin oxidase